MTALSSVTYAANNNASVGLTTLQTHPFFVDIIWMDVYEGKLIPPYLPIVSSGGQGTPDDYFEATDTRNFDREFTKLPLKDSVSVRIHFL